MSLVKEVVDVVRQLNVLSAQAEEVVVRDQGKCSTGPKTPHGRQRASINAVRHNLSGQHLVLQETEVAAYNSTAAKMLDYLKPKSEPERQIAQKIIDTNFRLNRMAAIENNMFSFGTVENEQTNSDNEDRIEVMGAQTRAWIRHAPVFDLLGRCEARLSRQLLKYQEEFERLQAVRRRQERIDEDKTDEEIEEDKFDPASFGTDLKNAPNAYRLLSYLPPPKGWKKPDEITEKPDEIVEKEEPALEKQAA